jgi:dihydrofolate synthase/folylpolyglutamate synthase
LAAFELFALSDLDVVLLEVGLGGRLDAVNIVDPDVAVVTTIALDHEDWLGNDRNVIGREKAGVFRAGKPAIYGEEDMPSSVCDYARELGAELSHWGKTFGIQDQQADDWSWFGLDDQGAPTVIERIVYPHLPLANACTAIQALYRSGMALEDEVIRRGVAEAQLTGRMQKLRVGEVSVLLDVAHNPHAASYMAEVLRKQQVGGKVWAVIGMLADKDITSVLALLADQVDRWCIGTLNVPRGQSAQILASMLPPQVDRLNVRCYATICEAYDDALAGAGKDDLVVVLGSFVTIADVLENRVSD